MKTGADSLVAQHGDVGLGARYVAAIPGRPSLGPTIGRPSSFRLFGENLLQRPEDEDVVAILDPTAGHLHGDEIVE